MASSTGEMTLYYHITNHLGSVRVILDNQAEAVAQNDYYAFGLKHENPNLAQHTSNRYLYNGKEEQTTGNVDLLDYGARMYDATLGRWHSVDPLAEKYATISPYVYTLNNPIRYIDPNGMDVWEMDGFGNIVNRIRDKTQDAFYMVEKIDDKWRRMEGDQYSISFAYGTIKNVINTTVTDGSNSTYNITLFNVIGDEDAQRLFEFMSLNNAPNWIEWSHTKIGEESSQSNMVGTTHQENLDASAGYLQAKGYTIREHSHSHPNSYLASPSDADKHFSKSLSGVPTYIYYNFNGGIRSYMGYNSEGIISSMRFIPVIINGNPDFQLVIKIPISK